MKSAFRNLTIIFILAALLALVSQASQMSLTSTGQSGRNGKRIELKDVLSIVNNIGSSSEAKRDDPARDQ